MYNALVELQERRESELRATNHYKTATPNKQFLHVVEELKEVEDARMTLANVKMNSDKQKEREHLAEEIADCQMSLETLARCHLFDAKDMRQARKLVIAKNEARGYYEGAE
jgi:arylamine N-acetyltransferase